MKKNESKSEPIEFEAPVEQTVSEEKGELDVEKMALEIEELQDELDKLRSNAEETHGRYLRVLADFDNFRKRQREETARQTGCVREDLLLKLLPITDNFERSLQAAEAEHNYESLVEGVSLTLKQLQDMMVKEGVEPIDAVGQEFNPELHEAMMRVETEDQPDNTIYDELEKGYTINGKVLRPARVRVAVKPE